MQGGTGRTATTPTPSRGRPTGFRSRPRPSPCTRTTATSATRCQRRPAADDGQSGSRRTPPCQFARTRMDAAWMNDSLGRSPLVPAPSPAATRSPAPIPSFPADFDPATADLASADVPFTDCDQSDVVRALVSVRPGAPRRRHPGASRVHGPVRYHPHPRLPRQRPQEHRRTPGRSTAPPLRAVSSPSASRVGGIHFDVRITGIQVTPGTLLTELQDIKRRLHAL